MMKIKTPRKVATYYRICRTATRTQAEKMKVDVDRESQTVWMATNLMHGTYVIS